MPQGKTIKIKVVKEKEIEEAEEIMEINNEPTLSVWRKIADACFYLLAALTPLFFLPLTIAPLEINKQVFAGLLLLLGFFCYLIDFFEKRKIAYPRSPIALAIGAFLAVSAVSVFFSKAKIVSLFGGLTQADSLLSIIFYCLAFLMGAILYRPEMKKKLAFCFFGGLAAATVFGLLQVFGKFVLPWDFARQAGFNTIGTPSAWAVYLAFGLIVIIAVLFNAELSKHQKISLSALGVIVFSGLIAVNYPPIWLTLALLTIVLAAYKFAPDFKLKPTFLIIAALFLFFGFIGQSLPSLVSLPAEIRPSAPVTWTIIKESLKETRILIGNGPAAFGYEYALYRPLEFNRTEWWPTRFNQGFSFITTLPLTGGVLGVLAVLLIAVFFVRRLFKSPFSQNAEVIAISFGTMFLMASWLFFPIFFTQSFFIFLGLGLITALLGEKREFSFADPASLSRFKIFTVLLILTVLITASLISFFFLGKKYAAAVYYEKGLSAYSRTGDINKAMLRLDKARRLDPRQDEYLRGFTQILILRTDELIRQLSAASVESLRPEIQNVISLALEAARQAKDINPGDSLNWTNLGNVYERILPVVAGTDVFAEENYLKAISLDPKNPQGPVNIARTFLAAADLISGQDQVLWREKLDKAKKYLEQSLNLKPDYATAHFLLATIYAREGKTREMIQRLVLAKQSAPFDSGLAFQLGLIYYQNGQFENARIEFERAVFINQNYSNARYFLGLIYDRYGNKVAALMQFKKIAELNPNNEEIKKIINNLKEGRGALEEVVSPAERTEAPVKE